MSPLFYIGLIALVVILGIRFYFGSKAKALEATPEFENAVDELMRVFVTQHSYHQIAVMLQEPQLMFELFELWTSLFAGTELRKRSFPKEMFADIFTKHMEQVRLKKVVQNENEQLAEIHKSKLSAWKKLKNVSETSSKFLPLSFGFILGSLIGHFFL